MKIVFFTFTFILFSIVTNGQEARLAQQYYQNGEYEKAGVMYEKLYETTKNDFYFNRFVECLLSLEKFNQAEDLVKKEIKRNPGELQQYVTYGNILERQYRDEEAEKVYEDAIRNLSGDQFAVIKLANAFVQLTKYDLAIKTYEKGIQILKDEEIFAYNLGNLYQQKGETDKMVYYYLISLEENPNRMSSLQAIFQRNFQKEDYDLLQKQLYEKMQKNQDGLELIEMLTWVFVQKKDYGNALRQARALDKRRKENGGRVFNLAEIAANDGDYQAAIDAYTYIIDSKGTTSPYYLEAKRQSLRCARFQLVEGFDYTKEDLVTLEQQYETFLNEFGWNRSTATIIQELAELEAFYLSNIAKAITILQDLIQYPGLNPNTQAEAKIQLADFYLMQGEIWESTLLYSQVDKAFKDDLLGHEARFKNAKLSYYNGDFQWAQAQFSVLKASTSKLIANDALDLSVFILDNLGLDTTPEPLILYAQADLLVFQNKFDEAFSKLDSIVQLFPDHSLEDDIIYLKARIYEKKKEFVVAAAEYERIVEKYPDEIRADNALFALGQLYEGPLNDLPKAMGYFEKIFLDYSNSTFAVDARKRFRILRGDDIQ